MTKFRWMLYPLVIPFLSSCTGTPRRSNSIVLTPKTAQTITVLDVSGSLSLDGVSVVTGTEDVRTIAGNNSAQTMKGSYGITDSMLGSGTVAFTEPANLTGDFFAISPTKLVVVTTTQGDPNPVIIVVRN